MAKVSIFLRGFLFLGGLTSAVHSSSIDQKKESDRPSGYLKTTTVSVLPYCGPAMADYTPCVVIRPKTTMFLINNGDVVIAVYVAPVVPVAHGPPNHAV